MAPRRPCLAPLALTALLALAMGIQAGCLDIPPDGDDDDSTEGPTGPAISAWPDAIDFGMVALGSDSVRTLTLENTGGESLLVVTVEMAGGYEFFDVEAFDGQRLEPGEYVDLLVMFHATEQGPANNAIRVASNDPDRPEVEIPVTATAEPPP